MTRVAEIMNSEIISCDPATPIPAVAKMMASRGVHEVFVLEDGKPIGLISDVDLLAGEWLATDSAGLAAMRAMPARDLMSSPIETVDEDETVESAVARMTELRIARLLVRDQQDHAAGVLSVMDVVSGRPLPPPDRHRVRSVMSHAIVTCHPNAPVYSAIRAMAQRRSRSIVVVAGGKVIGVLTGGDVMQLYASEDEFRPEDPVRSVMSSPVVCASPEMELPDAIDLMLTHEIHRLVVVDGDGDTLGIVSTSDVIAEMADDRSVWQQAPNVR
jgi:CBS domain-containing protein